MPIYQEMSQISNMHGDFGLTYIETKGGHMNLPDAVKHTADLVAKLSDAVQTIETDPNLAPVAQDLGDAWQDIVKIAKDLSVG